jgi:hypothetical protein
MDRQGKDMVVAGADKDPSPTSFDDLIAQVRARRRAARAPVSPAAWVAVPRESENAARVLEILERRMQVDRNARTTFSELAAEFGQTPKSYGRHLGQVASRIDAACWSAGLPLLGAFRIRLSDGSLNAKALAEPNWALRRQALAQREAMHDWNADDFRCVRQALNQLPPKGASLIWHDILERLGEEALRRALIAGRGKLG